MSDNNSLWITEDLNLNNILNLNLGKSVMSSNGTRGYYEHSGGHTAYVNYYTVYAYTQYTDYSNYSNACQRACQVCNTGQRKCDVNQFISYWIGTFDYNLENSFIFAQNYNQLISYINQAATWLNNLIDKYNLNSNLKVSPIDLNKQVAVSDIYEADQFNLINQKINNFLNGLTSILDKNKDTDIILLEDMEKIKTTLNKIQLPLDIPCCQTANYESCATRQK